PYRAPPTSPESRAAPLPPPSLPPRRSSDRRARVGAGRAGEPGAVDLPVRPPHRPDPRRPGTAPRVASGGGLPRHRHRPGAQAGAGRAPRGSLRLIPSARRGPGPSGPARAVVGSVWQTKGVTVGGRELRICVVGDELSAGMGDARGLGWVGRVVARTQSEEPRFVTSLAVPEETTTALSARWEAECRRRFAPGCDNRLVVA